VSRRRRPSKYHGLLPVDKASGPTSHDVVDMARRALGERRIGHTGTLDPMAEGLLLLCVGHATRLQRFLMDWEKTYRGVVRLGHATTTYDVEGEASDPSGPVPVIGTAELEELRDRFVGDIDQVPPPYSAKKVEGKKMYELARDGRQVELEAKRVSVRDLRLEAADDARLELEVTCSTGFYVRSLAHDLGTALGCGGHLERLRRDRIGPYSATDALPQAELERVADPAAILDGPSWVPIDDIRLPFPDLVLNRGATDRFVHGQEAVVFRPGGGDDLAPEAPVAVRTEDGTLLGVGTVQSVLARGRTIGVRPSVVLSPAPTERTAGTR
jgi:tRNA pseudouridine55 synthase